MEETTQKRWNPIHDTGLAIRIHAKGNLRANNPDHLKTRLPRGVLFILRPLRITVVLLH